MKMQGVFQINVPDWMRREEPVKAALCDLINADLAGCPHRTLEEFARLLNSSNIESTYQRIQEAVREQLYGQEEVYRPDGEPYYYTPEPKFNEEDYPF